jgi:hypothetical protein
MEKTRSNSVMSATVSGSVITWKYLDGSVLEFDADKCNEEIKFQAMMHGFKQKHGDASAMSRDPKTGKSASLAEKRDAMRMVRDSLYDGEWASERTSILLLALCELKPGKTREQLAKWMAVQTPKFLRDLRNTPEVSAVIERLRPAKSATEGINLDDLDAEIDAIE